MRCTSRALRAQTRRPLSLVGAATPAASPIACLLTAHRHASSSESGTRGDVDLDAIARPMGYGPFSATAKARVVREKTEASNPSRASSSSSADAASSTVMQNVTLQTNLSLRLSLAGLPHPSQLQGWAYTSPEWRTAMVRLYRTILRLHNKTVAVSLNTARGAGPEAAVSAITGVRKTSGEEEGEREEKVGGVKAAEETGSQSSVAAEGEEDDYLLRYLLTPEQQEFGNRFVQGEFQRHMDADAVSAAIFYASWYDYVLQLASGVTSREMSEKEKRLLSDEQKEKLNSLRGAFVDLRVAKEPQYMP